MIYRFSEYKPTELKKNHLNLGQVRADGASFQVNSRYIEKDGKPWIGIMGEYHFVRDSRDRWEQELLKMKAGGINTIASYVFWIYHEEIEAEYDFTGDRNLREFIELCEKLGFYFVLRIGPWCHGEVRNGGFPDWLLKDSKEKGYEVRTDDPRYLEHVRRFYEKTYEQAEGFLIKDNGPVIGVQIENEYGHCGGKNGEEGEKHMRTLLGMAKEIGFDVYYENGIIFLKEKKRVSR